MVTRQTRDVSKLGMALICGLLMVLAGGCVTIHPTPPAPAGHGWFTYSQGYREFSATSLSSTSAHHRTLLLLSKVDAVNLTHQKALTAADIRRQLVPGTNISEYTFNTALLP